MLFTSDSGSADPAFAGGPVFGLRAAPFRRRKIALRGGAHHRGRYRSVSRLFRGEVELSFSIICVGRGERHRRAGVKSASRIGCR